MSGLFDGNRQGIGCAGIIALLILYAMFSGGHKSGSSSGSHPAAAQPVASAPPARTPRPAPTPATHTVRYLVTTLPLHTGSTSITYQSDQGSEQVDYQGDWDKVLTLQPGAFAYLAVQNDQAYGTVVCTIFIDGQSWRTATATAAYGIATCSGPVPG